MTTDPFHLHPELAPLIKAAESSFFRATTVEQLRSMLSDRGAPTHWIVDDDVREADRFKALAAWPGEDRWVFAYGSLMWDPAFHFDEVRHAFAPAHSREFILKDEFGGRGTMDAPGVMAALDEGPGCHGLALRIAHDALDRETDVIWRRERAGSAYCPDFIRLETAQGDITALAFVADHSADMIDATLTWEEKVQFCATGTGFLGSSLEYVQNLSSHFDVLGIEDAQVNALLQAARDYAT
jgi:cation transport protein ChaC